MRIDLSRVRGRWAGWRAQTLRRVAEMTFTQRLRTLALLMGMPLAVLLALQLAADLQRERAVHSARGAVAAAAALRTAADTLRLQRLADARDDAALRAKAREQLVAALAAADRPMADAAGGMLRSSWQAARTQWLATGPAAPSWDLKLDQVQRLLRVLYEHTALPLERDAVDSMLADLGFGVLEHWQSALNHLHADSAAGDVRSMPENVHELETALVLASERHGAILRAGAPPLPAWGAAREANERMLQTLRVTSGATPGGPPEALVAQRADEAADALHRLAETVPRLLDERLARAAWHSAGRLAAEVVAALGLAAAIVVFLRLAEQAERDGLAEVERCLNALADGDLSVQPARDRADAFGAVADAIEQVCARQSGLLAELRSGAVRVSEAGAVVAGTGVSLAQQDQASANDLEQLRDQVVPLRREAAAQAQATGVLESLIGTLQDRVAAGSAAMNATVERVQALQDSARRVADVNDMIDDIAFQTGLLALNASVEAARAGEAGRGFAVVAAAIRQLAQRCTEAAGEVRSLIERTNEQVEDSSDRIRGANEALSSVATAVTTSAERLRALAATSAAQSEGLDQLEERVGAQAATRGQGRGEAEQAENTARSLALEAEALRQRIAGLSLRQGTVDEARRMVDRALRRVAQVGMEQAAAEFNRGGAPWVDRDLYLFAVDSQSRYRVFSLQPDVVGQSLYDQPHMRTEQADEFLRAAWQAHSRGGDWIEYLGNRWDTGEAVRKTGYVMPLAGDVFIGCSAYRVEAARPLASEPASANEAEPAEAGADEAMAMI